MEGLESEFVDMVSKSERMLAQKLAELIGSSFSGHNPISFPPFRLRPAGPVFVSAQLPVI